MTRKSKYQKSDDEWKKRLSPEAFMVLRRKGTEPPFSGKYVEHTKRGMYHCAGCGTALFSSETKFDSGSGWPSFWAPIAKENLEETSDTSLGMTRTEVLCNRCKGHLGHVFADGPAPTGLRYCINSVALRFQDASDTK